MDWFLYDNSHRHTSFFLVTQFFVQNLSSLLREIYWHRYCVKIVYFSLLHNLGTFQWATAMFVEKRLIMQQYI